MLKRYSVIFFVSVFFLVNPLSARINPQEVQKKIEAVKLYAQNEFAKVLIFKSRSDATTNVVRKNELHESAQDSADEMVEILDYLEDLEKLIKKEKRSLGSGYDIVLPREINDARSAVHSWETLATKELLSK